MRHCHTPLLGGRNVIAVYWLEPKIKGDITLTDNSMGGVSVNSFEGSIVQIENLEFGDFGLWSISHFGTCPFSSYV